MPGYEVGGKTGTAEKPLPWRLPPKALISTFVGMFPMNESEVHHCRVARRAQGHRRNRRLRHRPAWSPRPASRRIIENIVSLYGILPGDLKEACRRSRSPRLRCRHSRRRRSSCRRTHAIARQDQRKALPAGPGPNQTAAAPQRECVALLLSELMRLSADATRVSRQPCRDDPVLCRPRLSTPRKVRPGYLFAALAGVAPGRRGVRRRRGRARRGGDPGRCPTPHCRRSIPPSSSCATPTPRRRVALMAAAFAGLQPATIAAVTGTNGKSSTVHFVRHIWTTLGLKAASVGTLGIVSPGLRATPASPRPIRCSFTRTSRPWRARA